QPSPVAGRSYHTPFFGQFDDPKKNTSTPGNRNNPATMQDTPGMKGNYETCAICTQPQSEAGMVLDCITWTWNPQPGQGQPKSSITGNQGSESADFDAAVKDWNAWAGDQKGTPYDKVPPLKSPAKQ